MATSATAIAAAVARARRDIIEHLEQRGAFDPAHAVAFDLPSRLYEGQFDVLIGNGIVKETMEGNYWFDREAWKLEGERRATAAKKMAILILVVAALVVAVAAILGSAR